MSLLVLDLTELKGTVLLDNPIPKQRITLRHYRVQFDSAAEALACGQLSFDTSFLTSTNIQVTSQRGSGQKISEGFPLSLDNAIVTNQEATEPVELSKNIPQFFTYDLSGLTCDSAAGLNDGGFVSCRLEFSFDNSVIV